MSTKLNGYITQRPDGYCDFHWYGDFTDKIKSIDEIEDHIRDLESALKIAKRFYKEWPGDGCGIRDWDTVMSIAGTANANVVDHAQERLDQRGCTVENYINNPQLLAHHCYRSPVGQAMSNFKPKYDTVNQSTYGLRLDIKGSTEDELMSEFHRLHEIIFKQEELLKKSKNTLLHVENLFDTGKGIKIRNNVLRTVEEIDSFEKELSKGL